MRDRLYAKGSLARDHAGHESNLADSQHPAIRALAKLELSSAHWVSMALQVAKLRQAGVLVTNEMIVVIGEELSRQPIPEMPAPPRAAGSHDPLVYYVRFSDRIKIGTSTNLPTRLQAIPHDELLGTEPGGANVEKQRHQQFAEHRVVGEWFQSTPELLAHIATLQTAP